MSSIPPISAEHHYHAPLKPEPAAAPPLPARKEHTADGELQHGRPPSSRNGTSSVIDTVA